MVKYYGMKKLLKYFTPFEWILWSVSVVSIIVFFIAFKNEQYLFLATSLVGVTSLIFLAKGNLVGLILTLAFSVAYTIIAFISHYWSEVITYFGMTLPIGIVCLIQWIKNPHKGKKTEVEIVELDKKEYGKIFVIAAIITIVFYWILKWCETPNLIFATLSIFTSFIACYLSVKRSRFYAIAYFLNDIILIILWSLACVNDLSYLAIVLCFVSFMANDLYGFINWTKMYKRQREENKND